MQSLSDIIFEDINDEYGYGMYLGLKIIICKRNGFVNATKLCAKFSKRFENWIRNNSNKELIKYIEENIIIDTQIRVSFEEREGIRIGISGTYVHKLIIPHIASWISPEVAIKVSQIVNQLVISEKDRMLHEKDDKINELLSKVIMLFDKMMNSSQRMIISSNRTIILFSRMKKLKMT